MEPNEISNETLDKFEVLIEPAEQGSLEDVLGPNDALLSSESEQTPFPPNPIESSVIANIPVVDYDVDPVRPTQIVDVRIETSHIKNPG